MGDRSSRGFERMKQEKTMLTTLDEMMRDLADRAAHTCGRNDDA